MKLLILNQISLFMFFSGIVEKSLLFYKMLELVVFDQESFQFVDD